MGCNRKVKLLVSELFRGGSEVQQGHFTSDPASQNAIWRHNGFIYRKKSRLILVGYFLYQNAENRAKICHGTAEILECIRCEYKHGDARLTTLPSGSVNYLVSNIW